MGGGVLSHPARPALRANLPGGELRQHVPSDRRGSSRSSSASAAAAGVPTASAGRGSTVRSSSARHMSASRVARSLWTLCGRGRAVRTPQRDGLERMRLLGVVWARSPRRAVEHGDDAAVMTRPDLSRPILRRSPHASRLADGCQGTSLPSRPARHREQWPAARARSPDGAREWPRSRPPRCERLPGSPTSDQTRRTRTRHRRPRSAMTRGTRSQPAGDPGSRSRPEADWRDRPRLHAGRLGGPGRARSEVDLAPSGLTARVSPRQRARDAIEQSV